MLNTMCKKCGINNGLSDDVVSQIRTAFVEYKFTPKQFTCKECGHIHVRGDFIPPHDPRCRSCGFSLISGITEWL